MTAEGESGKPRDPVEAALAEYADAWQNGNRLDPDSFCGKHPEAGSKLRAEIDDFVFVAKRLSHGEALGKGRPAESDEEGSPQKLGDFIILREIGRGGQGSVFEAEQVSLKRRVALKVLPAHLSFSKEAVLKFRREAEAGGRQSHPGLVSIYAVGKHEGVHYIAQELVPGSFTLEDQIAELREQGEQPPGYFREVAGLIAEMCDALQHAHDSGVIHRDIKPLNILLTKEGYPKITDFGLARIEDALALSRTGDFSGTPYYMSPEQAASKRIGIDHRTDIFSLGVTLYEMLTFKRPFYGKSTHEVLRNILLVDPADPRKKNTRVPPDLATICLKAIEKVPEKRYASMAEFAEDLRSFLSGDVIKAKPQGPATRVWKRVKRNPPMSMALAGVLLTAIIFVGYELFVSLPKLRDALEEIERLSDVTRLAELQTEEESLWPAEPEKIDAMKNWLGNAEELVGRLDVHRNTLASLREKGSRRAADGAADPKGSGSCTGTETPGSSAWTFENKETQWQHDTLARLIASLEAFSSESTGCITKVEKRLAFAQTVVSKTIEERRAIWDDAIASISDRTVCPQYRGRVIEPIAGFVPIGRDPGTNLWEFAHLQTGEIPRRDTSGRIDMKEEHGLVFVLIPGGRFRMGAVTPSENNLAGSPNVDSDAKDCEGPIREIEVEPFLLSKYEMTQGQWLRLTGTNPSGLKGLSLLHPAVDISWNDFELWLGRMRLRFPWETEWEYSTRAGTSTIWWTGNDPKTLDGAGNLADASYLKMAEGDPGDDDLRDDGYAGIAPVGRFRPNTFGLHDVVGNVLELCRDRFDPGEGAEDREPALQAGWRVYRGGGWGSEPRDSRSAYRKGIDPSRFYHALGVRPARSL